MPRVRVQAPDQKAGTGEDRRGKEVRILQVSRHRMEPPSPVARSRKATAPIIHPPHGSRKGGRLMPPDATRCHQSPRAATAWNATAPRLLEGLKARGARAMSHTLMPVCAGATVSCSQRRTSHNIPQRATKRNHRFTATSATACPWRSPRPAPDAGCRARCSATAPPAR